MTLVDLWGRPYSQQERADHNARVAAGAPYAALLTVEEMAKRYRLLRKPKRVFDTVTGATLAPYEFHTLYAASNLRIGHKRVLVSQVWMTSCTNEYHAVPNVPATERNLSSEDGYETLREPEISGDAR